MIVRTLDSATRPGLWCEVLPTDAATTLASAGKCALAYLDPPFGSGKRFFLGPGNGQDGREAFNDPILDLETSLGDATALAEAASQAIADQGIVVVHTDINRSAHFRLAFDRVLGLRSFRGEVIVRSGARDEQPRPDLSGALTATHNTLLLFSRAPLPRALLPEYLPEHCQGRRPTIGLGFVDTLWCDLTVRGYETGYPTEKSRAFAERLLKWLTHPGDHIVEPFGGSATLSCLALERGCRVTVGDTGNTARAIATARLLATALDRGIGAHFALDVEPQVPVEDSGGDPCLVVDLDPTTDAVIQVVNPSARRSRTPHLRRLTIHADGRCTLDERLS